MITLLAWVIAVFPLISLTIFSTEVALGLVPVRFSRSAARPRTAILIPAHNEQAGIGHTVALLRAEGGPSVRILVIADNCSDQTAANARAAGAEVAERDNPSLRGKGFALAFGRDTLSADPPEVVVVLDADCWLLPGGLARLAAAATEGPAQAINLIEPDLNASPLVQISSFALLVKNRVRARATVRLGGVALLTGTGMAFPWPIFAQAPLATGDLVEDLRLAIELIRKGLRPRLIEAVQVRSAPAAQADTRVQRSRWEHGSLATSLRHGPNILAEGIARRSRALLAIGAHLLVPPLALLFLASSLALVLLVVLGTVAGTWWPPLTLGLVLVLAAIATIAAWFREGRDFLAPSTLLRVPLYALWKLPIYGRFLWKREKNWVRTRREGEGKSRD